jgi:hypothetical protein
MSTLCAHVHVAAAVKVHVDDQDQVNEDVAAPHRRHDGRCDESTTPPELKQIEIVTGVDSASCGVPLSPGESYLLWPSSTFESPLHGVSLCDENYLAMNPAEFELKRSELTAIIASDARGAGADGGLESPAAHASPGSGDDAEEGCTLGGKRHGGPAVWLSLSALAYARWRSRRRRSPALAR